MISKFFLALNCFRMMRLFLYLFNVTFQTLSHPNVVFHDPHHFRLQGRPPVVDLVEQERVRVGHQALPTHPSPRTPDRFAQKSGFGGSGQQVVGRRPARQVSDAVEGRTDSMRDTGLRCKAKVNI